MSKIEKFDFNDVSIVPATISDIDTRREQCNILTNENRLPIIVAPMDSCFSLTEDFNTAFDLDLYKNNIPLCYPRGYNKVKKLPYHFVSLSLSEFIEFYENNQSLEDKTYILVDIANGHQSKLYKYSRDAKLKFGDKLVLMVGNIANPATYKLYAEANVDFIRVGIGAGSSCTTSVLSNIHYPMASLVHECYNIKVKHSYHTKIVADGGFKEYSDIVTALALGADYVMLGGMFAKMLESNSTPTLFKCIKIKNYDLCKFLMKHNVTLYKRHIGMSHQIIQKLWKVIRLRENEGIINWFKVETTLDDFISKFSHALRTAMSYTNSRNLEEFKDCDFILKTENANKRYKK